MYMSLCRSQFINLFLNITFQVVTPVFCIIQGKMVKIAHGDEESQESDHGGPMPAWKQLLSVWKTWVIFITPIIFLPVPLAYPDKVCLLITLLENIC